MVNGVVAMTLPALRGVYSQHKHLQKGEHRVETVWEKYRKVEYVLPLCADQPHVANGILSTDRVLPGPS